MFPASAILLNVKEKERRDKKRQMRVHFADDPVTLVGLTYPKKYARDCKGKMYEINWWDVGMKRDAYDRRPGPGRRDYKKKQAAILNSLREKFPDQYYDYIDKKTTRLENNYRIRNDILYKERMKKFILDKNVTIRESSRDGYCAHDISSDSEDESDSDNNGETMSEQTTVDPLDLMSGLPTSPCSFAMGETKQQSLVSQREQKVQGKGDLFLESKTMDKCPGERKY